MRTRRAGAIAEHRLARGLASFALVAAMTLLAEPAAGALALSPLNGTPDASPQTQISFLGVPASEIADVSVVGSRSGRHSGRLESYASSPGASFLPTRSFTQGERVTASALIGPKGHAERVSTSFTIARLSRYSPPPTGAPAPAKAGTTQSFASEPALQPPKVAITTAQRRGHARGRVPHSDPRLGSVGSDDHRRSGRLVWYKPVPPGEVATNLQVAEL